MDQESPKPSYTQGSSSIPLIAEHISQRLRTIAAKYPDNIALISHGQKVQYTYSEFNLKIDHIATGLIALGLQKGDRIGIFSPNRAEFSLIEYAVARSGLILVNINPAFEQNELKYCINKVGIQTLVIAKQFKQMDYIKIIQSLVPQIETTKNPFDLDIKEFPSLKNIVLLDDKEINGMITFQKLLTLGTKKDKIEMIERERKINFEAPSNILFTSGTSGFPKAATLSHYGMINNALQGGQCMHVTDKDKICLTVPMHHVFGMVFGNLLAMNYGATIVLPSEGFDPVACLESINLYKATIIYGVPTMFVGILNAYSQNSNYYDISSLRTGFVTGASCPENLMQRICKELSITGFTTGYGMTECSGGIYLCDTHESLERKKCTVGTIAPQVESKIVDPGTNVVVKRGEMGEICVRGYLIMVGYWEDKQMTKEIIDDNGWLHTGDLGILDDHGYLKIIGRLKDMIIRGGENIFPKEIEEQLMQHPNIKEIQVIGVDDDIMGEEVCAWIILNESAKISAIDILDYCKGNIAYYKIPRFIRFVQEFPLTVTGKVRKQEMKNISNGLLKKKENDIQSLKRGQQQGKL